MIILLYIYALAIALFSIGLAGIAVDRHLVVIMLAVELMFVASSIALIGYFSYGATANPGAVVMLFAIFAVAAVEIIAVIAFYIYMKHNRIEFDVTKLSRLKW
jgi:NADH:ubiquinone oxidoreductase subunit K